MRIGSAIRLFLEDIFHSNYRVHLEDEITRIVSEKDSEISRLATELREAQAKNTRYELALLPFTNAGQHLLSQGKEKKGLPPPIVGRKPWHQVQTDYLKQQLEEEKKSKEQQDGVQSA